MKNRQESTYSTEKNLETTLIDLAQKLDLAIDLNYLKNLVEKLKTELITPDTQILAFNQFLAEQLLAKYPYISAIGVSGGAATGGLALKRLFSNWQNEDFDAFSVIKTSPASIADVSVAGRKVNPVHVQLWSLANEVQNLIQQLKNEKSSFLVGFAQNFNLCETFNYKTRYVLDISGIAVEKVAEMIKEGYWFDFILFFLPISPQIVGEQCQKKFLAALSYLAETDYETWLEITTKLKKLWKEIKNFKAKYLGVNLSDEQLNILTDEWTKSFDELVDETNN